MKPPLEKESTKAKAEMVRITSEGKGVKFIDLAPHEDEIIRGWINLYFNLVLDQAMGGTYENSKSL